MSFFFNAPVPEPMAEEPAKTGFARLGELVRRDFWHLFTAGLLALAGVLPFAIGVGLSAAIHDLPTALVFGAVGGVIAGPELCGMADTVLRGLQDKTSLWWDTYRWAWKRNAKSALLPGAVGGLFFSAELFLFFHTETLALGAGTQIVMLMGVLLVLGFSSYVWPQIALMELPFGTLVKNAALLFLGQLPRSIAALAVQAAYWVLMLEYLDTALPLLLVTNFWVPFLLALFLIYPVIEKGFRIEERMDALQKERRTVSAAAQDAEI